MSWLSRIGSLLDEIDSSPPEGPGSGAAVPARASGSDASPTGASSGDGDDADVLGAAFGRGFGLLTSAAAAASFAAAKATIAAADGAKGQFGGVSSTLSSLLRDDTAAEGDAGLASSQAEVGVAPSADVGAGAPAARAEATASVAMSQANLDKPGIGTSTDWDVAFEAPDAAMTGPAASVAASQAEPDADTIGSPSGWDVAFEAPAAMIKAPASIGSHGGAIGPSPGWDVAFEAPAAVTDSAPSLTATQAEPDGGAKGPSSGWDVAFEAATAMAEAAEPVVATQASPEGDAIDNSSEWDAAIGAPEVVGEAAAPVAVTEVDPSGRGIEPSPDGGPEFNAPIAEPAAIVCNPSPPSSAPESSRGLIAEGWSLAALSQQPIEASADELPTTFATEAFSPTGFAASPTPPANFTNGHEAKLDVEEIPGDSEHLNNSGAEFGVALADGATPPEAALIVANGDTQLAGNSSSNGLEIGGVGALSAALGASALVGAGLQGTDAPAEGAPAKPAPPIPSDEPEETAPAALADGTAPSAARGDFDGWSTVMGAPAVVVVPDITRMESVGATVPGRGDYLSTTAPAESSPPADEALDTRSAPASHGEFAQSDGVQALPRAGSGDGWQFGEDAAADNGGIDIASQPVTDLEGPTAIGATADGLESFPIAEEPEVLAIDAGADAATISIPESASPGEAANGANVHGSSRAPDADSAKLHERIHDLEGQLGSVRERANAQLAALRGEAEELRRRLQDAETDKGKLEAQLGLVREQADTQLAAFRGHVEDLQRRSRDAEVDSGKKLEQITRLAAQIDESSAALSAAQAASAGLEKQVDDLRRELVQVKMKAKAQAAEEHDSTLSRVREEMEQELQTLLKKKDDQVRALESRLAASEKTCRQQARELEDQQNEDDALREEMARLKAEGLGRLSDSQKELDRIRGDFEARVAELERKLEVEERQKHELALNIRSLEEHARNATAQLEVEKSHLEVQVNSLQAQLQEEQQRRAELSIAVGEAQHRVAELEGRGLSGEGSAEESEAARRVAEEEVRELRERVRAAEEKLLDSQSMRDMFAKETDMYRSELRVAREERARLEEDLTKVQERLRESQAARAQADPAGGQQGVVEAMQKDFEGRMERYRDEVQYLRQKCDEKDKRCEQLLAERASLQGELRNAGGGSATAWRSPEPDLVAAGDIEAGGKKPAPGGNRASPLRSMPLAYPAWLRTADEPLKMVVRVLGDMPQARIAFFAYMLLMHVWVLFILQQSAVH